MTTNFWTPRSDLDENAVAVIDEQGVVITRAELNARVDQAAKFLCEEGERRFGMLYLSNTMAGLVAYLACLRARHVPLLLPAGMSADLAAALQDHYRPDWVMGVHLPGRDVPGSGLRISSSEGEVPAPAALHADLGLLLSTSGTTGSPKLVRLSYAALQANAASIAEYLELGPQERALTVLPPYYSYGLSVINSHLCAGGALVLRDVSVLSPEFAQTLREQAVTSIAGVPYTYQMLYRTGFQKQSFPSLHTLTQAGGRLDDRLIQIFATLAAERGWHFFIMYGQTEATARISYVPPEQLDRKIGSIGMAIPRGQLSLDPETSELIYRGPNVMMGYALRREDLALGDELQGILRTGDLGRRDEDGFYFVTGRLKRFVKLAGNRVGLDEVEQLLQQLLLAPVAVAGRDERMVIWLETSASDAPESAKHLLSTQYGLHHSLCRIKTVERLPLLPTGKKDYHALMVDA